MKLALVTHAERPKLRGTLPEIWPEFMAHDPVVQSFWPRLYDEYPDFQIWVVDRDGGRAGRCRLRVQRARRAGTEAPSPRGLDWALTDGVEAPPTALCAVVAGIAPSTAAVASPRRSCAGSGPSRRATGSTRSWRRCGRRGRSATRSSRSSAMRGWRRGDGLPYDPWLRTHERLGGEILASAPRSMTVSARARSGREWTGMAFPEDGDYVVPGALRTRALQERPRPVRRAERLGSSTRSSGRLAALALLLEARRIWRFVASRARAPCCSCMSSSAARSCSRELRHRLLRALRVVELLLVRLELPHRARELGIRPLHRRLRAFSIHRLKSGTFIRSANSGRRYARSGCGRARRAMPSSTRARAGSRAGSAA